MTKRDFLGICNAPFNAPNLLAEGENLPWRSAKRNPLSFVFANKGSGEQEACDGDPERDEEKLGLDPTVTGIARAFCSCSIDHGCADFTVINQAANQAAQVGFGTFCCAAQQTDDVDLISARLNAGNDRCKVTIDDSTIEAVVFN